jgi:hypothetical protein
MQNYDYQYKTGSTRPTIRYAFDAVEPNDMQLNDDVDVVEATFSMRDVSTDELVVEAEPATLVDDGTDGGLRSGVVEYQLTQSQSDTAGIYVAEFELEHRDGSVRRIPAGENITIQITRGVA